MLSDKKMDKIVKILGQSPIEELESLSKASLEQAIVVSEQAMKSASEELEANPKYQEIRESLSALTQAKKDVNKYQRAKIEYILHLLESK